MWENKVTHYIISKKKCQRIWRAKMECVGSDHIMAVKSSV